MNGLLPEHIRASIEKDLLSVEVSTRCNSSCGHCFARAGRDTWQDMTLETALEIAGEGRDLGYRNFHITGGEPLMWTSLFDLVGQVLAMGYESVLVNTNGTLITADAAERLAGFEGRVTLSISLQGPEDLHDRVRGGSFREAQAGLERALAAGIGVCVFTVVGKSLLPELPRFAEFIFTEYPSVTELALIQLVRVHGDAIDLSAELLSPEDFLSLVRMTALLNLYGYRISVLQNPLATAASRAMGMPWVAPALPLHRGGGVIVMADGSITLAHSTRDSFGAYGKGALGRVLGSDDYGKAVGPDDAACGGCRFMAVCREHGMARPSEWFRSMGRPGQFCRDVMSLAAGAAGGGDMPLTIPT
ncbi:MAG TPA: radical SAM protein [Spirochaetota bacterium]|nr:radical SAM protein [Spirochaetota bacterium]HQF08430.1 radical SAM protein [Spirochaetota bacterium]HQH99068.1 radical SAM protein [Spirochaetota bacterium]HQJ72457.1 radical SAM protein [Spirochaetota bacterium]